MNESYYALEMMMKQRQRDVLRDADLRRIAHAGARARGRASRPSVFAPVLARVGRLLVTIGRRLETRAAGAPMAGTGTVCCD
jgi:hypothetical protein